MDTAEWQQLVTTGHRRGSTNPTLRIGIFTDYECPFCRGFEIDVIRPLTLSLAITFGGGAALASTETEAQYAVTCAGSSAIAQSAGPCDGYNAQLACQEASSVCGGADLHSVGFGWVGGSCVVACEADI